MITFHLHKCFAIANRAGHYDSCMGGLVVKLCSELFWRELNINCIGEKALRRFCVGIEKQNAFKVLIDQIWFRTGQLTFLLSLKATLPLWNYERILYCFVASISLVVLTPSPLTCHIFTTSYARIWQCRVNVACACAGNRYFVNLISVLCLWCVYIKHM